MTLTKQDILEQFKRYVGLCSEHDAYLCVFFYKCELYHLKYEFEEYLINENILKSKNWTINSLFTDENGDDIDVSLVNGFRVTVLEDFLNKCL